MSNDLGNRSSRRRMIGDAWEKDKLGDAWRETKGEKQMKENN
jgi:hypothetical protein